MSEPAKSVRFLWKTDAFVLYHETEVSAFSEEGGFRSIW
jgi:hypothetical protein